jgi:fructose-specific phosphotransferase system IIA component
VSAYLKVFEKNLKMGFKVVQMVPEQNLQPSCVKVPLQGKDKHSVITELVDLLDTGKLLLDKDTALQAVLGREQARSTGIGFGVAIPHGKCKAVMQSVMAIGITSQPIDFGSADGKPVSIVILLISPSDQTGPHLQALAKINRLMLNETLRNKLGKINAAQEACELFRNHLQNEPVLDRNCSERIN